MKATVSIAKGNKQKPAAKARASQQADVRRQRRQLYIVIGVLTTVVFACFLNSLGNGFVFDDKSLILENALLRSLSNLPRPPILLAQLTSLYSGPRVVPHFEKGNGDGKGRV